MQSGSITSDSGLPVWREPRQLKLSDDMWLDNVPTQRGSLEPIAYDVSGRLLFDCLAMCLCYAGWVIRVYYCFAGCYRLPGRVFSDAGLGIGLRSSTGRPAARDVVSNFSLSRPGETM